MFERLLRCKPERRCGLIHCCETCGDLYQKKYFYLHVKELNFKALSELGDFFYVVVGSQVIGTLNQSLNEIKKFQERLNYGKNRKRGIYKTLEFFSRLEVSFKNSLGFYPHLNFFFFGAELKELEEELYKLTHEFNLKFKIMRKRNDEETFKSLLWYVLKYNKMEWRKAMATQVACKGMREIKYTNLFAFTNLQTMDNEILPLIDFNFLKVSPIRSRKEVKIRASCLVEKSKISAKYREKLKKLKEKEKEKEKGKGKGKVVIKSNLTKKKSDEVSSILFS